ncbi:hypothetical protein KIF24_06825 [Micromonospora sp. Llam7]|uniref:hypothetical protein n=1 Tax=Micromonospora tarapacensis TaxID=2835305 RepID=UPI001C8368FA|nr:hypothetical protein [Micromonospora tarapacensis]MBX7265764.1 hypothetical protein [Micromonospora tarapacensis]
MAGTVYHVPVLMRGSHIHPAKGGCLVELSSTLPGGPWTACPAHLDRALVTLAQVVNDATSDERRLNLIGLVPWLVGLRLENSDRTGPLIAILAARESLRHADRATGERLKSAVAMLSEKGAGGVGRWKGLWRRRLVHRTIRLAVSAYSESQESDEALRGLLVDAINFVRELDGLPDLTDVPVIAAGHPLTLPVHVTLHVAGEDTHYRCVALRGEWPEQLNEAWQARMIELSRRRVAGHGDQV